MIAFPKTPHALLLAGILLGMGGTAPLQAEEAPETFSVFKIVQGQAVTYRQVATAQASSEKSQLLKENQAAIQTWEKEAQALPKDQPGAIPPTLKPETLQVSIVKAALPAEQAETLAHDLQQKSDAKYLVAKITLEKVETIASQGSTVIPQVRVVKKEVSYEALPQNGLRAREQGLYTAHLKYREEVKAENAKTFGSKTMPAAPKVEILEANLSETQAQAKAAGMVPPSKK